MTMLAETVDVVIGVDTHKHTHTAAVVVAATGAAVDELTIDTDPDGYAALVAMADGHSGLRAWSIEGTGGYGAGLCRYLAERGEIVIELDRPNRPARRNGAKSDPLDAVRAGREALAREHLAQPRAAGERAALAVRLAARRSAVDAADRPATGPRSHRRRPRAAPIKVPRSRQLRGHRQGCPAAPVAELGPRDPNHR